VTPLDPSAESVRPAPALDLVTVLDALPRAIVVTDPGGRILLWNRAAEALYGWPVAEAVGRSVYDVIVPIGARSAGERIVREVVDDGVWSGEFTVLGRDGRSMQVWVTNRAIHDAAGAVIAILGASEDVTEQRSLAARAADLAGRLQLALEAGRLGTWTWDRATGLAHFDPLMEALYGLEPGTFEHATDGGMLRIHPDDVDRVQAEVDRAVERGEGFTVEYRVVWPDRSVHWLHCAGTATLGDDGQTIGTVGCATEITDQVLGELERERLTAEALRAADDERVHRERLEFLGHINDALGSAHTYHAVMRNVVAAAVPRLGDWCSIYVLTDPDSAIPEVEIGHVDPAMVAFARELSERFPYDPLAPVGIPAIIRSGQPEFHQDITDEVIDSAGAPDEVRDLVHQLELRSAVAVPLIKDGRVMGAIQFVMTSPRRRYTGDDLALAQAVASRIASKLENLRLAALQRTIATTLQASLLPTELPSIPGLQVAVRYWAAGEATIVGGDLYDVFAIDDDRWAVVVGDVCGTGPPAAAVTGMARHTIASAAWHGGEPAQVLEHLNHTMRRRGSDRFLTAAFATIAPHPGGATFTVACGGHPRPVLTRPDGSTQALGEFGTLIGVFDEVKVTSTVHELAPGDVVVLHTDGATDVAPPHGLTADQFAALVAAAAADARGAEEVADRLQEQLEAILPIDERDDDIALVVLRVADPA